MALTANTIPTIVGDAILETLKGNLVYRKLFNGNYTGSVAPGNVVKIPSIGSVTIGAYSEYTDMDDDEASDAGASMAVDQQSYFSIVLDDVDAAMAKPAVMAAYASEATFRLQNTIDGYLGGLLATGGTLTTGLGDDTTPIEVNAANVDVQLRLMARMLDDAKVPRSGRFAVLPPWAVEDLVESNIVDNTNNADALANAMVAKYAGFDILMSQSVPNTTGAAYKVVAGSAISATMAIAINNTEMLRHPTQFADKFRGLAVYGGKVTRPDTICVATWNEASA
jgi:hypothetical protein